MIKAIGYVRVSTEDQSTHGVSLAAQESKLRAWAVMHDAEITIEVDAGISGKSMSNRPALARALAAIRSGAASHLVVCDLSRLTRRTRDLLDVVDRLFRDERRALVSIRESIDTKTPAGRMIVTVLGAMNEMEREQIGIRTRGAMEHLASQGKYTGGQAPYGQRVADDGETLVDVADEQAVLVEARALRSAGLSLRAIAATLAEHGIVSRSGKPFRAMAIASMTAGTATIAIAA